MNTHLLLLHTHLLLAHTHLLLLAHTHLLLVIHLSHLIIHLHTTSLDHIGLSELELLHWHSCWIPSLRSLELSINNFWSIDLNVVFNIWISFTRATAIHVSLWSKYVFTSNIMTSCWRLNWFYNSDSINQPKISSDWRNSLSRLATWNWNLSNKLLNVFYFSIIGS